MSNNTTTELPVKVYFENDNWYCEHVATFDSEEIYDACLPALEALAKSHGFDHVTESVEEVGEA